MLFSLLSLSLSSDEFLTHGFVLTSASRVNSCNSLKWGTQPFLRVRFGALARGFVVSVASFSRGFALICLAGPNAGGSKLVSVMCCDWLKY